MLATVSGARNLHFYNGQYEISVTQKELVVHFLHLLARM